MVIVRASLTCIIVAAMSWLVLHQRAGGVEVVR
jgi:hypothetical protein